MADPERARGRVEGAESLRPDFLFHHMKQDFKIPFLPALGRGAALILFAALAWLHCSAKIAFVTADLGRHLRNGEIFVKLHKIIATNFYAYTHPDFPTICHHWGSGVAFYLVWERGGFLALSVFYTAILVITYFLFMLIARRTARFWPVLLMAVLALPAVGYRTEIRPEGFTALFLAVEYLLLSEYRAGRLSWRWLWALVAVQWAWINMHILFFTGFALMTFFIIDIFVNDRSSGRWRALLGIAGAAILVSLLNPSGWQGLVEPFNIFKAYGYDLAENKDVFFMMKRFPGHEIYGYSLILLGIAVVLWALRVVKERNWKAVLLDTLLLTFFGLMAVKAIRAISMFALFFVPLAAVSLTAVVRLYAGSFQKYGMRLIMAVAAGLIAWAALSPQSYLSPLKPKSLALSLEPEPYRKSLFATLAHPQVWGGMAANIEGSANFFKTRGLRGPVFNNYDIGGYFIFYLFPQERPFVDNRPEAYPPDFFRKLYGPMQEKEEVWAEADKKYGFQVIYFYRHDQTTWAQPFLIRRLQDPAWVPVFVDGYTVILAKQGGVNQKVIDGFALPREMFRVVKN